ncbi:hypothetical protein C8R47DRAFT_1322546 [Mycena vitilis]|nr:hypothetical protein C8R47DRAFT_1322546 [Mycena vitilis]
MVQADLNPSSSLPPPHPPRSSANLNIIIMRFQTLTLTFCAVIVCVAASPISNPVSDAATPTPPETTFTTNAQRFQAGLPPLKPTMTKRRMGRPSANPKPSNKPHSHGDHPGAE